MSKFLVGECPRVGWQAAPSTRPSAPGVSPAAFSGDTSPSQENAVHAAWWQCPWAALVQATATGMEPLCAPAAAPAGPAALGDMVGFSLGQAGSTGEMELVLPSSVPRGVPTQEHPSWEDGHSGEF